jgi:hypothetical protein
MQHLYDEALKKAKREFCEKHGKKRLSEKLIEKVLDEKGYRLIGKDPYQDYRYHVAKWTDDKTASVTDGFCSTLDDIFENYLM